MNSEQESLPRSYIPSAENKMRPPRDAQFMLGAMMAAHSQKGEFIFFRDGGFGDDDALSQPFILHEGIHNFGIQDVASLTDIIPFVHPDDQERVRTALIATNDISRRILVESLPPEEKEEIYTLFHEALERSGESVPGIYEEQYFSRVISALTTEEQDRAVTIFRNSNVQCQPYHMSDEFRLVLPDGNGIEIPVELNQDIVIRDGEILMIGVISDATEKLHMRELRRAEEERVRIEARTDSLTHLWNRRMLDEIGAKLDSDPEALRNTECIMMDLNHFKETNDALGHAVGDKVLEAVALRIAGVTPKTDLFVRYGGDEFAIIFSSQHGDEIGDRIHRMAEKLQKKIDISVEKRNPVTGDSEEMHYGISIGMSFGYASGADGVSNFAELIRRADDAMYEAKDLNHRLSEPGFEWVAYSSDR